MEDLFVSRPEEYVRDINPMKNYVDLASFYLSKHTGDDGEEQLAEDWDEPLEPEGWAHHLKNLHNK